MKKILIFLTLAFVILGTRANTVSAALDSATATMKEATTEVFFQELRNSHRKDDIVLQCITFAESVDFKSGFQPLANLDDNYLKVVIPHNCGRLLTPEKTIQGKWTVDYNTTTWIYDFQPPKYSINTPGTNPQYDMSITDTLIILDNPDALGVDIVRKYLILDDSLWLKNLSDGIISKFIRYKGL